MVNATPVAAADDTNRLTAEANMLNDRLMGHKVTSEYPNTLQGETGYRAFALQC